MSGRVETGPVRIGDDWTGLFVRGDEAMYLANQLDEVLDSLVAAKPDMPMTEKIVIESLRRHVYWLHVVQEPVTNHEVVSLRRAE